MRRRIGRAALAAFAAALAGGCRGEAGGGEPPPPLIEPLERRVELRLYVRGEWRWNQDDTLRVDVVNGTAGPVTGALHLFVAAPVDLEPARGTETLSSGEGTRVTFPVRMAAGETVRLGQAVRTPPAPGADGRPAAIDTASRFAVRAWLAAADGRELATAADTIRIGTGTAVVVGGCAEVREAPLTRYGVGPLRLEMRAADLRALCPEARDTTWRGIGRTPERGLSVRVAGTRVLAVLEGERVSRIVVDSAGLRTPAGAGVGATLGELRATYGRPCAALADGRVAVRFTAAPGLSWALDTAAVRPQDVSIDPAALPDDARVDRLWVRPGPDDCPPPPRPDPDPREETP